MSLMLHNLNEKFHMTFMKILNILCPVFIETFGLGKYEIDTDTFQWNIPLESVSVNFIFLCHTNMLTS